MRDGETPQTHVEFNSTSEARQPCNHCQIYNMKTNFIVTRLVMSKDVVIEAKNMANILKVSEEEAILSPLRKVFKYHVIGNITYFSPHIAIKSRILR
jgi:hypothetical protein